MGDRSRFLQRFPILVGVVGGSLLLLNRLYTPELTASQSRADVVGLLTYPGKGVRGKSAMTYKAIEMLREAEVSI